MALVVAYFFGPKTSKAAEADPGGFYVKIHGKTALGYTLQQDAIGPLLIGATGEGPLIRNDRPRHCSEGASLRSWAARGYLGMAEEVHGGW